MLMRYLAQSSAFLRFGLLSPVVVARRRMPAATLRAFPLVQVAGFVDPASFLVLVEPVAGVKVTVGAHGP